MVMVQRVVLLTILPNVHQMKEWQEKSVYLVVLVWFNLMKVRGGRLEGNINGKINKFSYLFTASYEENGVQRDAEGDIPGLQYGLSDAETQNYFTKLGYQFDDDKALQLSYNFYSSQQKTDLGDVSGDINVGEKTYAIHVPLEQQKQGEPQGQDGNTNLMVKYTDYAVFPSNSNDVRLLSARY